MFEPNDRAIWEMSFKLESQLSLLEILRDCKPRMRKAILTNADSNLINAIAEICHNCLCGNIKLTRGTLID